MTNQYNANKKHSVHHGYRVILEWCFKPRKNLSTFLKIILWPWPLYDHKPNHDFILAILRIANGWSAKSRNCLLYFFGAKCGLFSVFFANFRGVKNILVSICQIFILRNNQACIEKIFFITIYIIIRVGVRSNKYI
jgi:hypothetical protein